MVDNPALHSLLILPYPAVVAGDRFREMYYWDSYFVIQGLLVSGMKETAKVSPRCHPCISRSPTCCPSCTASALNCQAG